MEESRLKLTSIRIINMHNVTDKTYNLSSGFTYFNGPNGAGKSTILEAIQLVVLGYIPGYAKTNEGIMKHSSASEMEVIGTFDNNITISHKWTRSGSSVSSKIVISPQSELPTLIDEGIELPIYNFNEFKDMTANNLKKWFISFLPSASASIDWEAKLKDSLKDRTNILNDKLLSDTLAKIEELSKSFEGVDLIQNLNTYLKSEQSFTKKEIERLEGTIQSLVHYDEELPDSKEEVQTEIRQNMNLLTQLSEYQAKLVHIDAVKRQLANLTLVDQNTTAQSIEEIESYIEHRNIVANAQSAFNEIRAKIDALDEQIDAAEKEEKELARLANSTCPYTSKACPEIEKLIDANKSKIIIIQGTLEAYEREKSELYDSLSAANNKLFVAKQNLTDIESQYNTFFKLRGLAEDPNTIQKPTDLSREEINLQINKLQESLSKIQANEKYNELIDTISKDKFNALNDLEVLKIWIKLTDANGLQTDIMKDIFTDFADNMNSYLTEMFGVPVIAEFNLSSKANSFSFGLNREGNYIEFDYLSSGERCLFTLAMMICILDRSKASLRTILIDDLVDHLDDNNAANVYEALDKIEDVQFILAGVKPCGAEGVVSI